MAVAVQEIPGVVADGMVKVAWVLAIANTGAPKLATEIKAATSVEDITCWITNAFTPNAELQMIEDRRMCSKQTFQSIGTVMWSIEELNYLFDPQNPGSENNKVYEAMVDGQIGFLVVGWGKDAEEDWAIGDVVDVFPVELGPRVPMPPESNSKLRVKQKPSVIGNVVRDVALVA